MKKVIVVGSLNMDLSIHAPYCPQGGETLSGSEFMASGGGKGANQAIAAGKFGANVIMCGCVGKDEFGEKILQSFLNEKISINFIRKVENISTGIAIILITKGENRIVLNAGANAFLQKTDIDKVMSVSEKGDIFLTQLENNVHAIGYGLKKAKEKGLFTILNPAPANIEAKKYFKFVDLIIPNESELNILGGTRQIMDAGVKTIVTTLGSRGYEITNSFGTTKYDCIKVNAVDTTGAGDTFCGVLAAELANDKDLKIAASFASRAASISCTKQGAAVSIPLRQEVLNYKIN